MPILAAETSIFPENLFELAEPEPPDRNWLAVYTKARQEKAMARQLVAREIPFYLPLVAKNSSSSRGRRVRSFVPLFNGYIFLFGTEEERVGALTTNRISRILPVEDQPQLCQDLMQVYHLIEADAPLTIERRIMPGRRVRVKAGAMMGMEGTVTSRRGACRLLVAINFLQQGVSVAIDDYMLEPLD